MYHLLIDDCRDDDNSNNKSILYKLYNSIT